MTISIRLDKPTEQALRQQLKAQKTTLSAYTRDAILEKLERDKLQQKKSAKPNPYELGKALFGRYSGNCDNLKVS